MFRVKAGFNLKLPKLSLMAEGHNYSAAVQCWIPKDGLIFVLHPKDGFQFVFYYIKNIFVFTV